MISIAWEGSNLSEKPSLLPTAFVTYNDLSALGLLDVLSRRGVQVPNDVSVVGFDNIPESALTEPPLTTVDQSIQALGREAVRILVRLINDPGSSGEPTHTTLPTHLIVRRSCAPPRR